MCGISSPGKVFKIKPYRAFFFLSKEKSPNMEVGQFFFVENRY